MSSPAARRRPRLSLVRARGALLVLGLAAATAAPSRALPPTPLAETGVSVSFALGSIPGGGYLLVWQDPLTFVLMARRISAAGFPGHCFHREWGVVPSEAAGSTRKGVLPAPKPVLPPPKRVAAGEEASGFGTAASASGREASASRADTSASKKEADASRREAAPSGREALLAAVGAAPS